MNDFTPQYMPILRYLTELRRRLLFCFVSVGILFCFLCSFSNDLYHWLALPLLHHLPSGGVMIATDVTATLFAPLKLTAFVAFFLAIPLLLYHLWAFIAPALYQHERRIVWPLLLGSSLLFYAGMAFAYFVVLPLMFNFFIALTPPGVAMSPDISQYLGVACQLLFAFGTVFEVPIAIVLLVSTGIVHVKTLADKRPYVIVGAFILGAILTPPDVISQTLLAIPLWLLFEVGIVIAKMLQPNQR